MLLGPAHALDFPPGPYSPIGRGSGLKIRPVSVRVRLGAPGTEGTRRRGHYEKGWADSRTLPGREYRNFCTFNLMPTLVHTDALARFGYALSDTTRTQILLRLNAAPAFPSELAEQIGVSRQIMSNHLACLRGCGLVLAVPQGRRTRYELADARIGHALNDLLGLVLAVDPNCACTGPDGAGCGCA